MNISKLSKAAKLSAYSYINQAISIIVAFIEVKIVTSIIEVSDYGAFNQIQTTVSLLTLVLSMNLGHGFLRFASSYPNQKKKEAFHTILFTQLALVLFTAIVFIPFKDSIITFLTGNDSPLYYFFIIAMSFMAFSISQTQNYLLVSGKDVEMVKQNLVAIIINAVFITIGVIVTKSVIGALWGYLLAQVTFLLYMTVQNDISYTNIKYNKGILIEILKFSLPLISVSVAYFVITSSNRYLINYYLGLDAVAQYSVANRLPMMLVTIFTLLSTVFLTNLSRLYDNKEIDRVEYWMSIMIRFFLFLSIAGAAFLIISSKSITLLVSNRDYLFPGLNWTYFFLSLGSIEYGFFQIVSRLFDLSKMVKISSMIWTGIMVINIVLNVLLIPTPWALVGSAIAYALTFFIGIVFALCFRPKVIKLILPYNKLLLYAMVGFAGAILYTLFAKVEVPMIMEFGIGFIYLIFILLLGILFKIVNISELKDLLFKK